MSRSKLSSRARASASGPVPTDERGVAAGLEALLEERDDALLVLGDQDAGHGWGLRVEGDVDGEGGAAAGRCRCTATVPWCARAMAVTIDSPMPVPSGRVTRLPAPRAVRSKIRSRASGGTPGPVSRTHSVRRGRSTTRAPRPISSPADGVLHGVGRQVEHRLLEPARRRPPPPPARPRGASSITQRAVAERRRRGRGGPATSSPTSTGPSRRNSCCSALASSSRSSHVAAHAVELVGDEGDRLGVLLRRGRRTPRGARGRW